MSIIPSSLKTTALDWLCSTSDICIHLRHLTYKCKQVPQVQLKETLERVTLEKYICNQSIPAISHCQGLAPGNSRVFTWHMSSTQTKIILSCLMSLSLLKSHHITAWLVVHLTKFLTHLSIKTCTKLSIINLGFKLYLCIISSGLISESTNHDVSPFCVSIFLTSCHV